MSRTPAREIAEYCRAAGFRYRDEWRNPPVSGVLFGSRSHVRVRDVVDAREGQPPFLLGRARGRGRRTVALLVLPLSRPVPNMLLAGATGSLLPRMGVALAEQQRLRLEGDFNARFSLFCPREYERDALYVFTPDLMERLVDAHGVRDVEFVDDRLLLYAPVEAFYGAGRLGAAAELAEFLHERLARQTSRYRDDALARQPETVADPFRQAQLTSADSRGHAVASGGRRIRTRKTALQWLGVVAAAALAAGAAGYWMWMVTTALGSGG